MQHAGRGWINGRASEDSEGEELLARDGSNRSVRMER